MKLMIASDIHGSAKWCARMIDLFNISGAERLLLLGDLLYHGPRNDLPEDYAPKAVIAQLNAIREKLFCVRGNCEAEVDQMVLSFPCMADYAVLIEGGHTVYATHGHRFNEKTPPPLTPGDVLLCGHTHIPAFERHEGFTYVNPGSVAIPKDGSRHSAILMEDGCLRFYDLEDNSVYRSETLQAKRLYNARP